MTVSENFLNHFAILKYSMTWKYDTIKFKPHFKVESLGYHFRQLNCQRRFLDSGVPPVDEVVEAGGCHVEVSLGLLPIPHAEGLVPSLLVSSPQGESLLDGKFSILLLPPGEEVGEDVVGVGVPGAPFDPGLHELLERLGQLSEQLKLLQHMVGPVQPVIMPLKDEILC